MKHLYTAGIVLLVLVIVNFVPLGLLVMGSICCYIVHRAEKRRENVAVRIEARRK